MRHMLIEFKGEEYWIEIDSKGYTWRALELSPEDVSLKEFLSLCYAIPEKWRKVHNEAVPSLLGK